MRNILKRFLKKHGLEDLTLGEFAVAMALFLPPVTLIVLWTIAEMYYSHLRW